MGRDTFAKRRKESLKTVGPARNSMSRGGRTHGKGMPQKSRQRRLQKALKAIIRGLCVQRAAAEGWEPREGCFLTMTCLNGTCIGSLYRVRSTVQR